MTQRLREYVMSETSLGRLTLRVDVVTCYTCGAIIVVGDQVVSARTRRGTVNIRCRKCAKKVKLI